MFYIEKYNPNYFQKKLGIIKIDENTIKVPITEDIKDKKIEQIALKTNKIIKRFSNSKKIVLSKQIQKEQLYVNYLNMYGIEISDGKWLYTILLPDIIEFVIDKKKIEKVNISILINDLTDIQIQNIKILARKYKNINIVTNHIEKFARLAKTLEEDEGIIITFTNNKKKSLMKSQIIINVDFPKELINKYNLKDDAIIINVKSKAKIMKKRFEGLTVNDYEIDFRDDKKDSKSLDSNYNLKDLYESKLYKKQGVNEIKEKMKLDKVVIKKLILNNGELSE